MKRLILTGILCAFLSASLGGQSLRMLVGTYTENTASEGVYLYSFDPQTAESQLLSMAPSGNPSFVIVAPGGRRAYAVNEFNDGRQGVSSFVLEGDRISACKSLPIPKDKADGEDPCNLLFTGDAVVSSNYTGGSVTAFQLDAEGELEALSQFYSMGGEYVSIFGQSLGQMSSHMHCATLSPDGRYIFVTDLGMDRIYRFVRGSGGHPLGSATSAWQHTGIGQWGPRHLIFSADGRFAYLLCELADKLVVFSYANGQLTPIQTLTAYSGKGKGSADLHLSPDGRFLYTSHRLKKDGIAIFRVDAESGKVSKAGYQPTGRHPRNFALTPDGRFLLCACRDDNVIEVYRVDSQTGALSPVPEAAISLGAPVCVQFITD